MYSFPGVTPLGRSLCHRQARPAHRQENRVLSSEGRVASEQPPRLSSGCTGTSHLRIVWSFQEIDQAKSDGPSVPRLKTLPFCMQTWGLEVFYSLAEVKKQPLCGWESWQRASRPSAVCFVAVPPGDLKMGPGIKTGQLSAWVGMPPQSCPASLRR